MNVIKLLTTRKCSIQLFLVHAIDIIKILKFVDFRSFILEYGSTEAGNEIFYKFFGVKVLIIPSELIVGHIFDNKLHSVEYLFFFDILCCNNRHAFRYRHFIFSYIYHCILNLPSCSFCFSQICHNIQCCLLFL